MQNAEQTLTSKKNPLDSIAVLCDFITVLSPKDATNVSDELEELNYYLTSDEISYFNCTNKVHEVLEVLQKVRSFDATRIELITELEALIVELNRIAREEKMSKMIIQFGNFIVSHPERFADFLIEAGL